ncbi:helix-turn-helix domain-containing protein [Algisphaera agarilytica]|uniref:AraC-like DNA-binding protein n=1 Tax=Algisphaera agarilytica TaxID=1385975 RepID=A0A7X0LKS2_9BACT|nr:AraC family transcriptional regulator [Algisphaera agarilytica]MBB6430139.1 AraC-like DNA-binding protein [Algisphaera agarilytica]
MERSASDMHWSDPNVVWAVNRCLRTYPEPGWSIGPEWSGQLKDLDLWLILGGRGWMRCDGEEFELRRGVALVARAGSSYEAWQDLDDRLCVDAIHFDLLDQQGRRLPGDALPPRVLSVADLGMAEAVSRRLRERRYFHPEGQSASDDRVSGALLRGLLLDLDHHTLASGNDDASDEMAEHRTAVQRALSLIHEKPGHQLTVADLAEDAGYSPDHFSRIFRSLTGRSPQAAMIHARLDRARHLLRSTPMSISQIAEALEYSDAFFFSRQFKKFVGESPTQYRQKPRS